MESKAITRAILVATCLAGAISGAGADFWEIAESDLSNGAAARKIVSEMTVEELAGQVLMLGYQGSRPDDEFLSWMKENAVGGIKVFGWNGRDLIAMAEGIAFMQAELYESRSGIPLIVATDQEGGWVRHVKGETSITPGNLALGASGLAVDAYRNGVLIGTELRLLGINMNFAPTVDIYVHPEADVIGPRSFSGDPADAGFLASAFYRGQERVGVISTAKHFPGHGNTDEDSHGTLPRIYDDMRTIWERDLLPYRMLVPEGLPAIMTGHLGFPLILGEGIPSTLSPVFIDSILRGRMGFDGVVITDDMIMYGARRPGESVAEACRTALAVGNDIVLVSGPPSLQKQIHTHIVNSAVKDDDFLSGLRESVRRIVSLKLRYFRYGGIEDLLPDSTTLVEKLRENDTDPTIIDLAGRSVTVLADRDIPFSGAVDESILLLGQYTAFIREGKRRYPNAESYLFSYEDVSSRELDEIRRIATDAERIVLCLANYEALEVLQSLEDFANRITVFSVLTPVFLRDTPWADSVIATYSTSVESFRAGFAVLSGDFEPEGTLPIPRLLGG